MRELCESLPKSDIAFHLSKYSDLSIQNDKSALFLSHIINSARKIIWFQMQELMNLPIEGLPSDESDIEALELFKNLGAEPDLDQ